jgi:ribonuclease D
MLPIKIIENEKDLSEYYNSLIKHKINKIALDMEGDQGSVKYHYSISIIQCFDGTKPSIIDVKQVGIIPLLKDFLTCENFTKIMFSCRNDLFMTQNVLGYSIYPIRDIAVAQKLLGLKENISDYIGIDRDKKDLYQRANWLKRPLSRELLEYAANDVTGLLAIEDEFSAKLQERGLYNEYIKICSELTKRDYRVNQLEQYKNKFPGYKKLSKNEKEMAKIIWIYRELFGEYFNCPSGYIFSKKIMIDIIKGDGDLSEKLKHEMNRRRGSRKKIDDATINKIYNKALAKASKIK